MRTDRIQGFSKANKVARNQASPLMDELIKGMLTVCSGLAPVNRPGLLCNSFAIECNVLSVAFHGQLLEIRWEALEILFVRHDANSLGTKEIVIPHRQNTQDHWYVAFERRDAEVLIHFMKAVQHGAEVFRPDGQHGRETNGRIHRVAPADPVPKAKHVGGVNAKLSDFLGVGRNGYEVFGNRAFVTVEAVYGPLPR